jgi:hypothetical protein
MRLSEMVAGKTTGDKTALVTAILNNINGEHLRLILKSIAICERNCKGNCPLWIADKQWFTPLKNVQAITEKFRDEPKTLPLLQADFTNEIASIDNDKELSSNPKKDTA